MYNYFIYAFSTFFLTAYGNYIDTSGWDNEKLPCGLTRYDNESSKLPDDAEDTAQMGQFPWVVRLGLKDPETNRLIFYCGGALISRQYVLSAAHCGTISEVARIGENNNDGVDCEVCICPPPHQDIKIRTHLYADHCRMSNKNDITIVALAEKVSYNDFVRPICVPIEPPLHSEIKTKRMFIPGWGAVYSGFGLARASDYPSNKILRYIESPILDLDECKNVYVYNLDRKQYCVGYTQKGDKPCAGDSGGPLIGFQMVDGKQRAFLVGIASYDLMKCEVGESRPVVYTNVGGYSKWIVDTIMKDKENT